MTRTPPVRADLAELAFLANQALTEALITAQMRATEDRLDDLRELLAMPRIGRPFVANPDPASSFTRLLLTLFGALALVTCSVQVGILHGRASCQLPNLARVGP